MPTFSTPEPITATLELVAGIARIVAGDRGQTVVTVQPSDDSHELDRRAAEQTQVEYAAGRLLVRTPKQRGLGLFGRAGSVDVTIELPAGSRLDGSATMVAFHCSGRLGDCRIKITAGDIQLDDTGPLELSTGAGTIAVNRVVGPAGLSTGTGKIRLGDVDGSAVVKNANGDNWIGQISGDLRVRTANGDIDVDQAQGDVTAATANGSIRVGGLVRGTVSLKTAAGQIEIGVRTGTAARLDVHTSFGRVRNQLDAVDGPEPADETVDVRARTSYGDIVIRRTPSPQLAGAQEQK